MLWTASHIVVAAFFILYAVVFLLIKKYKPTFNIKIWQRIALWLIHTIVVVFFYGLYGTGWGFGWGDFIIAAFVAFFIALYNLIAFLLTLKFDSARVLFISSAIIICLVVKFDFSRISLYAALLTPFLFGFLSRFIDKAETKKQIILASFLPIICLIIFQICAGGYSDILKNSTNYDKIEVREVDIKEIGEE